VRTISLTAILLCAAAYSADKVYQAPSPEPTAEETLTLEYINRFRANPSVEGERVLPANGKQIPLCPGFDLKLFKEELKALQPAPPLVFNLALLEGARKHAHYMIVNAQGHTEEEGKPGFTGKMPWDRAAVAGYTGDGIGENVARDLLNPWHTLQGFVVDWKMGAPGGMRPERGHRKMLLNKDDREVGIGMIAHRAGLSCVQNFGNRAALPRLAGGVIYVDLNENKFYDIGEGVEGATITAGDVSTATWTSGAYALELPNTDEVTLTAKVGKQIESKRLPVGRENVKFDFAISPKSIEDESAMNAKELSKQGPENAPINTNGLIAYFVAYENIPLSPKTRAVVDKFAAPVKTDIQSRRSAMIELLRNYNADAFNVRMAEHKKHFAGTAAEMWFDQIAKVADASGELLKLEAAAKAGKADAAAATALRERLDKFAPTLTGQLKLEVYRLIARINALGAKQ
jgi:hypothetical protein